MDWTKSYSSEWRIFRVNRRTWADAEKLPNVISASITKTGDGDMIESGSFQITGSFEPDYYRIVLTAEQGGEVERVDVATLLFNETGGKYDYGVTTTEVNGSSVLYPASTEAVLVGEYAPAGVDGAEYAGKLLADSINAPVEVEGSFTLNENVVHQLGSTVLSAVWAVLNAGNFIIQIDGRGVVHIRPRPTEPALIIDSASMGQLENGISHTADTSDIPNRYVVIDGIDITTAENNNAESTVSSVARGYYIDVVDTSPTPINGEPYKVYADRMLKELSVLKTVYSYSREFAPNVYPYSMVKATINGLNGNLTVQSQDITCDKGILITEKSAKETKLYE